MITIALKLEMLIDEYLPRLNVLNDTEFVYKSSPEKWSKKEITGHLIDSAQNNIRRLIVAQYDEYVSITYDQDKWVAINDYQHQPLQNVVQLWYLLNKQMVSILKNTSNEMAHCISGSAPGNTIEWLASDYIKHLVHHIHQVLNLEPMPYP
ncbi:MAG: DinB family protein [Ginsengibacter sp.]